MKRRDFLRASAAIIITPGLLMPVRRIWTPQGAVGVVDAFLNARLAWAIFDPIAQSYMGPFTEADARREIAIRRGGVLDRGYTLVHVDAHAYG